MFVWHLFLQDGVCCSFAGANTAISGFDCVQVHDKVGTKNDHPSGADSIKLFPGNLATLIMF